MPEARSFSSILNSSGKVNRATNSCRKDRNSNSKKRRPAATARESHVRVYCKQDSETMSAGQVDKTPHKHQRNSISNSEKEDSAAQADLEA